MFRLLLVLPILCSSIAFSAEILIENPPGYRIRDVKYGRLAPSGERVKDDIKLEIPDNLVIRDARGNIELEKTLERWRSASKGQNGDVLIYPGGLGSCKYQFVDKWGCDLYPFKDESGNIRYTAVRFMVRDGEKTEVSDDDFETKKTTVDGKEISLRVRKPQTKFSEVTGGKGKPVINRYNRFTGKTPAPFIGNFTGSGWKEGEGLIKILNDIKQKLKSNLSRGDFYEIVNCNKSALMESIGPWTEEECYLCNCANEAGIKSVPGKVEVNRLTLTRVVSKYFPQSNAFRRGICSSVMFQNKKGGIRGAAYSWTMKEDPYWANKVTKSHDRLPDPKAVKAKSSAKVLSECIDAGIKALELGPSRFDHYLNPKQVKTMPKWSRGEDHTPIGDHWFYDLVPSDFTFQSALDRLIGDYTPTQSQEESDAGR